MTRHDSHMTADRNRKSWRGRMQRSRGDRMFVLAGFSLAAAAAFFPWYVFLNEASFGDQPTLWRDERNPLERAGAASQALSNDAGTAAPFDPITTATVGGLPPGLGHDPLAGVAAVEQAFPGAPQYQLVHVANGRALIEDKSGMYMVKVGSALPDNSTLATMEQRDGKWVIVTSNGDVISE